MGEAIPYRVFYRISPSKPQRFHPLGLAALWTGNTVATMLPLLLGLIYKIIKSCFAMIFIASCFRGLSNLVAMLRVLFGSTGFGAVFTVAAMKYVAVNLSI